MAQHNHTAAPCWFERILERVLERWVERCMPDPNRIVRGGWGPNFRISERSTPLEDPMTQTREAAGPADTKFGYDVAGIKWSNAAGNPVVVDPTNVKMTSSNTDVVEGDAGSLKYLGNGMGWFMPKDSATEGAQVRLVWSADETGDKDDVILVFTVLADRLLGEADGITLTERTEALPVEEPPPPPPPVEEPPPPVEEPPPA